MVKLTAVAVSALNPAFPSLAVWLKARYLTCLCLDFTHWSGLQGPKLCKPLILHLVRNLKPSTVV